MGQSGLGDARAPTARPRRWSPPSPPVRSAAECVTARRPWRARRRVRSGRPGSSTNGSELRFCSAANASASTSVTRARAGRRRIPTSSMVLLKLGTTFAERRQQERAGSRRDGLGRLRSRGVNHDETTSRKPTKAGRKIVAAPLRQLARAEKAVSRASSATGELEVSTLVRDLVDQIDAARKQVAVAANAALTTLYWQIGHRRPQPGPRRAARGVRRADCCCSGTPTGGRLRARVRRDTVATIGMVPLHRPHPDLRQRPAPSASSTPRRAGFQRQASATAPAGPARHHPVRGQEARDGRVPGFLDARGIHVAEYLTELPPREVFRRLPSPRDRSRTEQARPRGSMLMWHLLRRRRPATKPKRKRRR